MTKRFFLLLLIASLTFSIVGFLVANAVSDTNSGNERILFYDYENGLGAGGYDVVSYLDASAAVSGKAEYEANFGGKRWQFSSVANRDKFAANPARYIPQYGGHCAYAMAQGSLAYGDPEAWTVHDDKLYFNYNKEVRGIWLTDVSGYVKEGDQSWEHLNQ